MLPLWPEADMPIGALTALGSVTATRFTPPKREARFIRLFPAAAPLFTAAIARSH